MRHRLCHIVHDSTATDGLGLAHMYSSEYQLLNSDLYRAVTDQSVAFDFEFAHIRPSHFSSTST